MLGIYRHSEMHQVWQLGADAEETERQGTCGGCRVEAESGAREEHGGPPWAARKYDAIGGEI